MISRRTSMPALALTLILSLPPAGRPLPAQEPSAPASARTLLEKGAFAEEHERDFARAEALYADAVTKARSAGDAETLRAAEESLLKLHARQGKVPAGAAPAQEADFAIQRRIFTILLEIEAAETNEIRRNRIKDLAIFGAAAVPVLERALSGEALPRPGANTAHVFETGNAAQALAAIDAPEASEALKRGLASPDPLTRRAIAGWLDGNRHRALLELAAKDSSAQVRESALARLAQGDDPALAPLMIQGAKEGGVWAARWLARNRIDELFGLLRAEVIPEVIRGVLVEAVIYGIRSPDRHMRVLGVLRALESVPDPAARERFWSLLGDDAIVEMKALDPERRGRFLASAASSSLNSSVQMNLLSSFGSLEDARFLAERLKAEPDPAMRPRIAEVLPNILEREKAEGFDLFLDVMRSLPEALQNYGIDLPRFLGRFSEPPPPERILAGLAVFRGGWRGTYLEWVVRNVPPSPVLVPAYREALSQEWIEKLGKEAAERIGQVGDAAVIPDLVAAVRTWSAIHETKPLQPGTSRVWHSGLNAISRILKRAPDRFRELVAEVAVALQEIEGVDPGSWTGHVRSDPAQMLAAAEDLWPRMRDAAGRDALFQAIAGGAQEEADAAWLLKVWPEVKGQEARMHGLRAFARLLYEPAIPLLGAALDDKAHEVRELAYGLMESFRKHREAKAEYAAWTAGDREARESIAELLKLLESSNRDVVLGAVRGLGAVKAKSALPALVKLLLRDDPDLKSAIHDAIAKIGG